jgi:uncharacterized protein Yka (UPF0111/DUF47 family)
MLSVQRWLEKDNRCFDLLEASGGQARASVLALADFLKSPPAKRSLEVFDRCRAEHKRINRELTQHLCVTFVTPIEREDIAKLGGALNRVSKASEKFVERFQLAPKRVEGWDLTGQVGMLKEAAELMGNTVTELCHESDQEKINAYNNRMQQIEGEADRLLEETLRSFYQAEEGNVAWVVRKDLAEQLEKVFDRCRSVGNVTYWTLLKNT